MKAALLAILSFGVLGTIYTVVYLQKLEVGPSMEHDFQLDVLLAS